MDHDRKPILSHLQFPIGCGPQAFAPLRVADLMMLYGQFSWQYHDLCLFHQAIYAQINHSVSFEHEQQALQESRRREMVFTHIAETRSMEGNADQLIVIGLWAMTEQYCGRALTYAESRISSRRLAGDAPHQWQALVRRFKLIGINLQNCRSYQRADECRILNNKIKHAGAIDAQLGPYFLDILAWSVSR